MQIQNTNSTILKAFKKYMFVLVLSALLLVFSSSQSFAGCCGRYASCLTCVNNTIPSRIVDFWEDTTQIINDFTDREFRSHREWYVAVYWEDNVLPALMLMANQLTAVAMEQTMIIGSFIDAKHQMETQRVLQTIRARAHKDYHPSGGMCEFGSSVKSLAATERKAELNAHVLSQRSQDRQLGNANTSAAGGPEADYKNRLNQYKTKYCDPNDNNAGLRLLCDNGGGQIGATDQMRVNKDIDYTRTLEHPWTMNVDFTNADLTHEEEDVMALASNLYGHEVFSRIIPSTKLVQPRSAGAGFSGGDLDFERVRNAYLDMRALLAKRSVAENSFNAITSMKSAGTSGSREFLQAILTELGATNGDALPSDTLRMLGMNDEGELDENIGPSYNAQMEVLTKKIYQNPDFYTNLYDKPANVERKRVAMQAIGLMQKFDLFKSYLRNEANISVLLELALQDLQVEIENEFLSPQ